MMERSLVAAGTQACYVAAVFTLDDHLKRQRLLIEQTLERILPSSEERPRRLHEAMRYSVFAGGKRLRPLLCLAAAHAVGGATEDAVLPATALELFHTFTLIHDDLPAMDDDLLRRGKPTCHVAFGEATAILAGDALQALAFEVLTMDDNREAECGRRMVFELAAAAGTRGVAGGQMEDIEAEGAPPSAEAVMEIHDHKTAALFKAAVRIGGIAGGGTEDELNALTVYGGRLGLAFQIVDDVLNETSRPELLGKATKSDIERGKMTYVRVFGLEASRAKALELVTAAKQELLVLGGSVEALAGIADLAISRNT